MSAYLYAFFLVHTSALTSLFKKKKKDRRIQTHIINPF